MSTQCTDDFNMSAEPIKFGPFTITLPPNKGGEKKCILCEATEAAHNAYKAVTVRAMRVSADVDGTERRASLEGGQEADATLVARCLFVVKDDGSEHPVTLDFVLGLPRRITLRLYKKIRDISGMDEDEETVEFLTHRITSDQKKLERLKRDGEPGKSDQPSTPLISS